MTATEAAGDDAICCHQAPAAVYRPPAEVCVSTEDRPSRGLRSTTVRNTENLHSPQNDTGVWAQSTLGSKTFLPEDYVWKMNKMLEFYVTFAQKNHQKSQFFMIFARIIPQIPKIYMIFARKMPEFHTIIANIFLFWGRAPCLPLHTGTPSVSYALWNDRNDQNKETNILKQETVSKVSQKCD